MSTKQNPFTTVIVDDEPKSVVLLQRMLKRYCPGVEVIGTANNTEKAYELINTLAPELVFLDVEMPDGSGFHLLKKFSRIPFRIVFTTAYDKYAIPAIRFSATDYLLKPISITELKAAVAKVAAAPLRPDAYQSMPGESGLRNAQLAGRIALPSQDGVQFVAVDEIIYCESSSNYTFFHLKSGVKLVVCRTLKEYEEQLGAQGFFRIHQSYLINLRYVKRYIRGRGGYVIMENNIELAVSTRKKDEFLGLAGDF
jgi:two-component system LytT family response regulator